MKPTEIIATMQLGIIGILIIVIVYALYKLSQVKLPDITDMWREASKSKSLEAGKTLSEDYGKTYRMYGEVIGEEIGGETQYTAEYGGKTVVVPTLLIEQLAPQGTLGYGTELKGVDEYSQEYYEAFDIHTME